MTSETLQTITGARAPPVQRPHDGVDDHGQWANAKVKRFERWGAALFFAATIGFGVPSLTKEGGLFDPSALVRGKGSHLSLLCSPLRKYDSFLFFGTNSAVHAVLWVTRLLCVKDHKTTTQPPRPPPFTKKHSPPPHPLPTLSQGLAMTVAAVVGKMMLGAWARPATVQGALTFGAAMMGRGEFSFLIADAAATDGILNDTNYSAVIWALLIAR